jgi:hypothetical protein
MHYKDQYDKATKLLEKIFAEVPDGCEEIRIGMRVWYGDITAGPMYIVTDYLHFGNDRTRVRFGERNDQIQITQGQLDSIMDDHGWTMGQPLRRSTTEYLYTFHPSEGQHRFSLRSQTAQVAERRHQQRVFEQYALTV